MDSFPSSPPAPVRADLVTLRASLDQADIPPKCLDRNVLIGTWNIRGFGKVLDRCESAAADSPKRNLRDVLCLAEVISRFDVVALQEVKRAFDGLRRLMEATGPNWGWTLTDFTRGKPGNHERMDFVFDLRRVRPSGLAAELVVPIENETSLTEVKLEKQFARTPYAVRLPRTIFQDPEEEHFYDQIAWFVKADRTDALTEPLRYERLGGNFDFRPALQGQLSTTSLSWRISDHFPLWASFGVRPS